MISKTTSVFANKSFLFFLIVFSFAFHIANGQNPGGVLGDVAWYKANSGISLVGGNVSVWNDSSPSANTATQGATAIQPGYTINSLNFNQAVTFSAGNYLGAPVNNLPAGTSARSVFVVAANSSAQTTNGWVYGYGNRSNSASFNVGRISSRLSLYVTGFSTGSESAQNFWIANVPKLGTVTYNNPAMAFFDAGAPNGTANQPNFNTVLTTGSGRIGALTAGSNENWIGTIAEIILYPSVVTGTDAVRVESYLAIKYGIHKTGNYLSSTGNVIWDATANTAYHNDVFGIGQDDASGLLQTQSNSTNTGSGDGTGQSAKGNIIISNPSTLVNNGFLMIGHDLGLLAETQVIVAGKPTQRVQRTWKVQSSGNPGTVSLSYDVSGLTYSAQSASNYVLLVDPTGTGNFDGGSVARYSGAAITGNKVSFNAVDLPTGAVFTFQTMGVPTVQATNIVFSSTTATSTTVSWTNGNGSSRAVFMYAGATGTALPIDLTTYTANTVFGTGTQIGSSGWYCVYNDTGTTVNVTGLVPLTTYQVMTVEYSGILGTQLYLSTISTGNPAGITLPNNVATLDNLSISQGTLTPVFATGTTAYTANVANAVTSLTVTPTTTDANATVTVNGVAVTSGNPSGAIALAVGPNVIATVVTAQDGTTTDTYSITVNRTALPPVITSFSPESGPVGTTVTINGANFGATIAENVVYFGAVKATITAASANSLTVSVPVGMTYQTITVLNQTTVLSGNSIAPFVLTFTPNKGNITTDDLDPRVHFGASSSIEELVVGDFDGDGKSDIAMTLAHLDQVLFLRNTATSGTIDATSFTPAGDANLGDYPVGISIADLDGDGKLDIIAANYHVSTISILRNTSSGIGDISFAAQLVLTSGLDPYRLVIGDIDGDGKLDIATSNKSGNSVSVLRNVTTGIGNISFDAKIDYPVSTFPYGIVLGDLDGDNKIDIITASANSANTISILRNTSTSGVINFEPQVNFSTGYSAYDVAIGDLNKDGKGDLAIANANGNFVSLLTNISSGIGNINFGTHIDFPTNAILNNVQLGDIDGDGNLDLAACDAANELSIFRNTSIIGGAINFSNRIDFVNENNANSVVIGDLDGDGLNDLATANYEFNNNISIFRNNPLFAPTVQATNVTFTNTTGTSTTASWTNGNGSSRAVFLYTGTSGSPLPVNFSTYIANPAFGTGTQIGSSGWYSIYNGTASTVDITGLNPATQYQLMVVEYNGSIPGNEMYQTAISTGNPASITTLNNIATLNNLSISSGTLDPVFASATTIYTAIVPNAITSLTLTPTTTDSNATVTVNGVNVASGSPSGGIALVVGSNVITTVVTAEDGTTIETYTVTITRTEPTIVTTGTLSGLSTIYGTPSTSGNFNISGTDMSEGILVTAPSGFEVSADDINFTNTITVGAAGIIASTPVYIRLKGTIPVGSYSGDVVLTSNGAATVNVATISSNVTTATLTITADNQTKTYGSANPTLTASYTGFVNGDSETSLTTPATISTTADATSVVGSYPITASGAVSSNYTINYVDGSLSVTTATLTITADNQTKTYGSANPTLTLSFTGFVNGDSEVSLTTPATISTTADATSIVGSYPITASGAGSSNYTISYVDGSLSVTTATLTITADNQTKTYGSANPTLTASYIGFVNGDSETSLTTPAIISTTADATSIVGSYPITASGAVNTNYTISYVDGSLSVTTANLTIAADNKNKVYGDSNPTLTASYTGFVNGDSETSLTTPATISTTADATSIVGSYPITVSGAVSSNYTINYVDGSLSVTTATLTITADNQAKTYGSANPTLTASYNGFVNGDSEASLTTPPTISTPADATSIVGSYPITASGAVSSNYTIIYVDGSLSVKTATLTITADNQAKTYGSANPTLTASYTGFVNGDSEVSLTTPATISTIADATSVVGSYPIAASGAVNSNYTINYVDGNLSVTTATLTITADNQTKTYGSANPTLTLSFTGFVNGDSEVSLTTPATISTTADATSIVGSYPITASGAVNSNYTINYVDGSLSITTATLTITADNQTKTYGSANPTLTASYTGFVNGDSETSLTTAPTISTTADATSIVGSYPITASGAVSSNYTINYVDGSLSITTATLTITADNQTKTYGSANPTLTASYTGFVNGDSEASLTTPATISTTADVTSIVGSYPITASGAVSSNYTINYVDGNLSVTTAALTITADNKNKVYGDSNPTLTASYTGFVNGDSESSLTTPPTISTPANATSIVGSYPITAIGAVSSNYTINYVDGSLSVTTATLTITADNQTKKYGSANPTLTASYTGFVNGDSEVSLTTPATISTIADATSIVGSYPITASGAVNTNYTINYVDGSLSVTTATLTITADNQMKIYGSTNPTLTASYIGFVNGDSETSLTTPATISTIADATSIVGSYPITASGAVSSNYTISYVDGSLSVTTATLTITADNQTKTYGSANPTLTASYSGFVNGDSETSLTTTATVSTTADASSIVGSYPITASGALSSNYTINYVDGSLSVTTATLTITADNQTKTYGSANPTLTASYIGFINGDSEGSLATPPTISTTADATSIVGSYPITASGALSSNYTINYVDGSLSVTTATLTITADNQTKTYGSANPNLTASYTGFVNGDSETSLTTPATISTTADVASIVGSYPITASGAVSSNYTINYIDGSLSVTTATLTITADNQTKTYGSANPTLTASYTGFVNGDSEANLTTPATISTIADATSIVGSYPITASGAVNSNYTINYVDGSLSITTATLTITANNQTKTYGSANPTLTASYTGFVNGDSEVSLTTPATISTIADATSIVGSYPITASGAVSSNYTISYVGGSLSITTATLTITADNQMKTYGSANPTLTASYNGFVNGDSETSLITPATISTTADATSIVGSYPITVSGAVSSNYAISYVGGSLSITTATLTITADNQTKTYGSANPTLTASYAGFVNGDLEASLTTPPTISTTADASSIVGNYPIKASGAVSSNYTINYVDGSLSVTTATLTITADNQTKTYGSANPTLTASYTGFVNGDSESSLTTPPTISTPANATSIVGSYPITASGAVSSNYTISYVDGILSVTTAALTITADNQTKTYGSANPILTASYSGFVNGDSEASLTTPATISTTADATSIVGSYPITASGAVSSNYTISYVDGNLNVTKASLNIIADNKIRVYGIPNPLLTASYGSFVNGDTAASLTTLPTITTTANQTSPVGDYPITASGAASANYSIAYIPGTLIITSPSDANLVSLSISNGSLNPAFSSDILLYNVAVASNINTETITVVSEDPLSKITINGVTIVSGGSLTPISLITGMNSFVVKVTSEDGLSSKTYILNITKDASNIATLSNLAISTGILDPAFKSDVNNYNSVVKYDVNSITVIPTATDPKAKITVNGLTVANNTASPPIILNTGENTIETVVTAEDGLTKEIYTIVVYKGVSPDAIVATNILSPNGDGKNDFWEIKDIQLYPNNKVTVYDRAGRIVYSKSGYSNEWDGSFRGAPLNNDTYYYLIDLDDKLPSLKGFITMIRD
jgi:gliding motility-associated-like protein